MLWAYGYAHLSDRTPCTPRRTHSTPCGVTEQDVGDGEGAKNRVSCLIGLALVGEVDDAFLRARWEEYGRAERRSCVWYHRGEPRMLMAVMQIELA